MGREDTGQEINVKEGTENYGGRTKGQQNKKRSHRNGR